MHRCQGAEQVPDFQVRFLLVQADQSWQRRYRLTRVSLRAGAFFVFRSNGVAPTLLRGMAIDATGTRRQ
jgi:hypothetical protein